MSNSNLVGVVTDVTQFGKKRANEYACYNNNLKFSDTCECTEDPTCMDSVTATVAAGALLAGATFDGIAYQPGSPIYNTDNRVIYRAVGNVAVEDTQTIKQWLEAIAKIKEVDVRIEVSYVGDQLTITHYGACPLSDITFGATTTPLVRCCETVSLTKWANQVEGTILDLSWDGNGPEALANNPYTYAGVPATDTATAATLQTDFTTALTALGVPLTGAVVVTVNDVAGAFDVTYNSISTVPVTVGTVEFQDCGSELQFNCP